jgi:hypothetical protein
VGGRNQFVAVVKGKVKSGSNVFFSDFLAISTRHITRRDAITITTFFSKED